MRKHTTKTAISGIAVGTVAFLMSTSAVHAATLWTNPITATDPSSTNPFTAGDVTDSNITDSGILRGSGLVGSTASNRFSASSWSTTGLDLNDYFDWTMAPTAGATIDFTSLTATLQRSSSGPVNYVLRSSLDGFTADVATGTVSSTTSSYTLSLADALFNSITSSISFRLYAYGGTSSGGTLSVNDFLFDGSISGGTGPATLNWTPVGGSSAWDTAAPNWTNNGTANSVFTTGSNVIFDDAGLALGNTVTAAAGGVTAGTIAVTATSGTYVLNGGNITGTTFTKTGAAELSLGTKLATTSATLGGGSLTGTGTLTASGGPVSVAGSVISPGNSGTGTLTFSGLAFSGATFGTGLNLDIDTPTTSDKIIVTGALSATGFTTITLSNMTPSTGTYTLISSGSNTALPGNFLIKGLYSRQGSNYEYLSTSAGGLNLVVSPTRPTAGTFTLIGTSGNPAWLTGSNWSAGAYPTAYDVADLGTTNATGVGINLNTMAGTAEVGQLKLSASATVNREVVDSSPTVSGSLTLNGVDNGAGGFRIISNESAAASMTIHNNTQSTLTVIVPETNSEIYVQNTAASVVISSDIQPYNGGGSILKTGDGKLTLSGNTNVPVTVSAGVLNGVGPLNAGLTLNNGSTLVIAGTGTVGTLTTSGVTFNDTANLFFDLGSGTHDLLDSGGNAITFGANNTINVNLADLGGGLTTGTVTLMNFASVVGTPHFNIFGPQGSTATFSIVANGNQYNLVITNTASSLIWNGSVNSNWDVTTTSNFTGPGGSATFKNGDFVTFDDSGTGANGGTVTIAGGGVKPDTVTVSNNGGVYTFTGGAIGDKTGGTTAFVKSGSGDLVLNNTNTFTGTFTQNAGKTTAATLGALGAGSVSLTGGTLILAAGGTTARSFSLSGGSEFQNTGNLVLTSALSSGTWTKTGSGTLTLNAPSSSTGINTSLNGGVIAVTAVDTNGVSGLGTGTLTIGNGGTFRIDASGNPSGVHVGYKADGSIGPALVVNMTDGSTLEGRGEARLTGSGGFGMPVSGNVTFSVPNAGDSFITGNSIRNAGSGGQSSTATATITGAGLWQLGSGGTSQSTSGTQYSGTWIVNMAPTGIFAVGPVLQGGFGEALNALGYQAPTATGLPATYSGPTRAVTINNGIFAFGADSGNPAPSTHSAAVSNRSALTFNGGSFASTGYEYDVAASNSTVGAQFTSTPVTANYGADMTFSAGATVTALLYDPIAKATAGGRSINIMTDANAIDPSTSNPVSTNLSWGANSTLVVDATGVSSGFGSLNFSRTTGTVSVGSNAKLQINANAAVAISGTMTPLAAAGTYVNVVNNGSLAVNASAQSAGAITGTGTTSVTGGAGSSLSVSRVVQGSLAVTGAVTLRSNASVTPSKVSSLTLGGSTGNWTGKVDITTNTLIVQPTAGNKTAAFATLVNQVTSGKNGGTWDGNGVTSSSIAGNPNATLALADNADLGWTSKGDQTLDTNSIVITRALIGDINLDGNVDLADYDKWYKNVGTGTAFSYAAGDVNMDGNIDLADYDLWYKHVGAAPLTIQAASAASVAAVPEPASLAVLAVGSAALLGRRRRSR